MVRPFQDADSDAELFGAENCVGRKVARSQKRMKQTKVMPTAQGRAEPPPFWSQVGGQCARLCSSLLLELFAGSVIAEFDRSGEDSQDELFGQALLFAPSVPFVACLRPPSRALWHLRRITHI